MSQTQEHKRLSIAEWRQRSDEDRNARRQEMDARRDTAKEMHQSAIEAQQTEAVEFMDAGYEETLPGQAEIDAGTVEHTQVLNSFPNATSYGPDVNVVAPDPAPAPEEPPPEEPVAQDQSQWQPQREA